MRDYDRTPVVQVVLLPSVEDLVHGMVKKVVCGSPQIKAAGGGGGGTQQSGSDISGCATQCAVQGLAGGLHGALGGGGCSDSGGTWHARVVLQWCIPDSPAATSGVAGAAHGSAAQHGTGCGVQFARSGRGSGLLELGASEQHTPWVRSPLLHCSAARHVIARRGHGRDQRTSVRGGARGARKARL